jgi:HlyD family secretion protein
MMKMRTATQNTSARRTRGKTASRKTLVYLLGAGLLALIVIGLLPKPIEVEIGKMSRGPLIVSVLEEGKTRIRHRYVISSPVPGYLRRVPVRAGDSIVAGETVLATIQSTPSTILDPRAKAQAEAAVRAAEATRMQRREAIGTAAAELDLARKELKREEELRKKGAISVQEYDTASSRAEVLETQLNSAKFGLKVAEFELEQARAALVQASSQGAESGKPIEIRTPVTGYVLNIYEESARAVTQGMPIMEIGDPADLEAEIELLSSDAVNVKAGADVSIEQWGGEVSLHGKVVLVEPGAYTKVSALGVEEQRVKVRVNFTDLPEGRLGDRYRVEARIITWSGEHVVQVPTGALFRRGNDWMTFVIDGGKAKLTKVEIDHDSGIAAEVKSGLREGQQVILHPPDTVSDGVAVKARRED